MADQLDINQLISLDTSGNPVSGARAYFFATGTTTPLVVYSNAALTSPHSNPMLADSGGVFSAVYYGAATGAKVRVDTSAGEPLYTIDPVRRIAGDATGAASITFSPTTDIPEETVQAAIERVQANASVNFEVITKTAGYTVVEADKTKLIRCTNALTLALTAAATLGDGFTFYVKSISGVVVTIDPASSETIDGAATLVVNGWARVYCDGANWHSTPVAEVLDEDDMASDDPLSVPTQQSTKAYVDAHPGRIKLISTQTNGSAAANMDVVLPTSGYSEFEVRFRNVVSTSDTSNINLQLQAADNSYRTSGYKGEILVSATVSVQTASIRLGESSGAGAGEAGLQGVLAIGNSASGSLKTFAHGGGTEYFSDGKVYTTTIASVYDTAEVHKGIRLLGSSGNIAAGATIELWGQAT